MKSSREFFCGLGSMNIKREECARQDYYASTGNAQGIKGSC